MADKRVYTYKATLADITARLQDKQRVILLDDPLDPYSPNNHNLMYAVIDGTKDYLVVGAVSKQKVDGEWVFCTERFGQVLSKDGIADFEMTTPIKISEEGARELRVDFTADSIIGALNELKTVSGSVSKGVDTLNVSDGVGGWKDTTWTVGGGSGSDLINESTIAEIQLGKRYTDDSYLSIRSDRIDFHQEFHDEDEDVFMRLQQGVLTFNKATTASLCSLAHKDAINEYESATLGQVDARAVTYKSLTYLSSTVAFTGLAGSGRLYLRQKNTSDSTVTIDTTNMVDGMWIDFLCQAIDRKITVNANVTVEGLNEVTPYDGCVRFTFRGTALHSSKVINPIALSTLGLPSQPNAVIGADDLGTELKEYDAHWIDTPDTFGLETNRGFEVNINLDDLPTPEADKFKVTVSEGANKATLLEIDKNGTMRLPVDVNNAVVFSGIPSEIDKKVLVGENVKAFASPHGFRPDSFNVATGGTPSTNIIVNGRVSYMYGDSPYVKDVVTTHTPNWSSNFVYSVVYFSTERDVIESQGSFLTPSELRTKIPVCILSCTDGAGTISGVLTNVMLLENPMLTLRDLYQYIQPKKGLGLSGTATATFGLAYGQWFVLGGNADNSGTDPNNKATTTQANTLFFLANRSLVNPTLTTSLRNTNFGNIFADYYDLNGTDTVLPSNNFQVLRVYGAVNDSMYPTVIVQKGQATYANLESAITGIQTEAFVKNSVVERMLCLGAIVIKKGTTATNNINDCRLITSDMLGQLGSAGGGSGGLTVIEHNSTLNLNTGDYQHLTVAQKEVVIDPDVQALANLATTGLITRTGSGGLATRTLTSGNGSILITNGSGVTANPAVAVNFEDTATNLLAPNSTPNAGSSAKTPRADHVHPLPKATTPTGTRFLRDEGAWQTVSLDTVWGDITGTLSNQLDLQDALKAKKYSYVDITTSQLLISIAKKGSLYIYTGAVEQNGFGSSSSGWNVGDWVDVTTRGGLITVPNMAGGGLQKLSSADGIIRVVWDGTNFVGLGSQKQFTTTKRVFGRNTSGGGLAEEVSASQILDWTGASVIGDILVRGATTWERLGKGSTGQVLTITAGGLAWVTPSGGTGLLTESYAIARILTVSPGNSYPVGIANSSDGSADVFSPVVAFGTYDKVNVRIVYASTNQTTATAKLQVSTDGSTWSDVGAQVTLNDYTDNVAYRVGTIFTRTGIATTQSKMYRIWVSVGNNSTGDVIGGQILFYN